MSFPFPTATIPELPNNAVPPLSSLLEISNSGVSENTSIQQLLNSGDVEFMSNKGAVSGYAGLDAAQELLLTNFPSGTALQLLRRNAGNTALEFVDPPQTSPLTTKGDLYTFDTDNTRLSVGSDGRILSANSAISTGLQWIDPPVTGLVSINGDTTSAQIMAAGTGLQIAEAGATHTYSIDSTVATLLGVQVLENKTLDDATNIITGIYGITGLATQVQTLNVGNNFIQAVLNPVNGSDAATKDYVDQLVNGLSWKNPARLATTGNITLSGNQTIDGFLTVTGDRVLVKDQTSGQFNGVYTADAGAWTRTTDTDESDELVNMSIYITAGTTQEDTSWVLTTDPPIVVDTTVLDYAQVGAGAGNPLTTKGDIFGYDTGGARIPVGTDNEFLMADSADGLGVSYSLVNNANVAAGKFDNITSVASGFNISTTSTVATLELEGVYASPGGGENIGRIDFSANNDDPFFLKYASIDTVLDDPTSGNEKGRLAISVMTQGNLDEFVVFNNFDDKINIQKGILLNAGPFDVNQFQIENVANLKFDSTNVFILQNGDLEYNVNTTRGHEFFIGLVSHHKLSAGLVNHNAQNATQTLELEANHSTPAAAQVISNISSYDDNSVGVREIYARIETQIFDPLNGSEDGVMTLYAISSGNPVSYITLNDAGNQKVKLGRNLDMNQFEIDEVATINFDNIDNIIQGSGSNLTFSAGSGGGFTLEIDGFTKAYTFNETEFQLDGADILDVLNITLNSGGKLSVNSNATNAGLRDIGNSADPSSPAEGDLYYNTISKVYRFYNGTIWDDVSAGGGGSGDVVGPASSTDNAIARFDLATGKLIKNGVIVIDNTANMSEIRSLQFTLFNTPPGGTIEYIQFASSSLRSNVQSGATHSRYINNQVIETLTVGSLNLTDIDIIAGQAFLQVQELLADPGTPGGTNSRLYTKDVGARSHLFIRDDVGEVDLQAGGGGDVTGPASSVDNEFVRFNGVTGKIIQDATISSTLSDAGEPTWARANIFTNFTGALSTANAFIQNYFNEFYFDNSVGHRFLVNSNQIMNIAGTIVNLTEGVKLQVNSSATRAGFKDFGHTADPSTPSLGDLYFNTSLNEYRSFNGLTWDALGGGGASPLTTKGDLFGYDTGDARIPVGTNGQVLTANSAVALGVEWAAGGDVTGPGSSTDNAIAIFNTTTGKIIQQSGSGAQPLLISDLSNLSGVRAILPTASNAFQSDATAYWQYGNNGQGSLDFIWNVPTASEHRWTINGAQMLNIDVNQINAQGNPITGAGLIGFTSGQTEPAGSTSYIWIDASHMVVNMPTGDAIALAINSNEIYTFDANSLDFLNRDITTIGTIEWGNGAAPVSGATSAIWNDTALGLGYNVPTADEHRFFINNVEQLSISSTIVSFINGKILQQVSEIQNCEGLRFDDDAGTLGGTLSFIQRSNSQLLINSPTGEDIELSINGGAELTIALNQLTINPATNLLAGGDVVISDRLQANKGPDVTSATTITVGDGNYFDVTAANTINHMTFTGWQLGSMVTLQFDAGATVNHNTGTDPANTVSFFLSGSANQTWNAGSTLTVVYDGVVWREVARSLS